MPVVVGNASQPQVREVFEHTAHNHHSPIIIAGDNPIVLGTSHGKDGTLSVITTTFGNNLVCQLSGDYQAENINTALHAIDALRTAGVKIGIRAVKKALAHVCEITGFMARWMVMGKNPTIICDAGHNAGAWQQLSKQLREIKCEQLHMVLGFSADKDCALNDAYTCNLLFYPGSIATRHASSRVTSHGSKAWLERQVLHTGNHSLSHRPENSQSC